MANDIIISIKPVVPVIRVTEVQGATITVTQPPAPVIEIVQPAIPTIEVSSLGARGIQGEQGVPGVAGGSYEHIQSAPATVWTIDHNLGFYPNVAVIDSSNRQILTDVEYINMNTLKILSDAAFGGKAFLS